MTKRKLIKTITLTLSLLLVAPYTNIVKATEETKQPAVVAESGIVMDYDTGEIIYEKNANEKMYLASTTKIMTALLFAEHNKKSDNITYSQTAKDQPPYTLRHDQMELLTGKTLNVGDKLSADVAMKSLLLFSANDVAYMISDEVGGNTTNFAKMMNDKAAELGLTNTHFENPNGLPVNNVDVNYSNAYELALLTKAAFENDWVRETMALSDSMVTLPQNVTLKLQNRNEELGKNGNIGGKTGVTNMAGTCFTGVYERDGKKYLTVVLKCDRNSNTQRFVDIDKMMDYSEDAKRQVYKSSGEEVGTAELQYKVFGFFGPTKTITAPIVLNEDVNLYSNDINDSEAEISVNTNETSAWKVASANTTSLTVSVKQFSTTVNGKVNLSVFSLIKANIGLYLALIAVVVIVIVLVLAIVKMISNSGRKRSSYNRRRRRY